MGDMGDTFRAMREAGKAKRAHNLENSIKILEGMKIPFERFSETHLRVVSLFDFWPSTGKYINLKTKKAGRGIRSLLLEVQRMQTRKDTHD